MIPKLSHAQE